MNITKCIDIVSKLYTKQELTHDMYFLNEIWHDLYLIIMDTEYSKDQILNVLKEYFSNIFISLFELIDNSTEIMDIISVIHRKLQNIMDVTLITCTSRPKSVESFYKEKIRISYEKSDTLIGGWLLIDEKGNIIDRSFAFLNFVR